MKKMFLLISFLLLLIVTYSFKPIFNLPFYSNLNFTDAEYSFYCLGYDKTLVGAQIIDNNSGYIVKTNKNNLTQVKSKLTNVLGESIRFKTCMTSVEKIIKSLDINKVKEEMFDGIVSIYGFSKKLSRENSVIVDDELVNVQISFKNDTLTMGTPIILGDY